jgi:hypothetical protein
VSPRHHRLLFGREVVSALEVKLRRCSCRRHRARHGALGHSSTAQSRRWMRAACQMDTSRPSRWTPFKNDNGCARDIRAIEDRQLCTLTDSVKLALSALPAFFTRSATRAGRLLNPTDAATFAAFTVCLVFVVFAHARESAIGAPWTRFSRH